MIYQFHCTKCGKQYDRYYTLEQYILEYMNSFIYCDCGGKLSRDYTPPIVQGDTTVKEQ